MAAEKATALVLRTTDWSETSRIATLWTREFGKVRALAKGGRRLRSNFESALDLLTVCSIVFLRKSSGGLDLLTEAQVVQRFPRLRTDLAALYAAYYIAELLSDWTEDYDPHPRLFDAALESLQALGTSAGGPPTTGLRLGRFEMVLLQELGHSPALEVCALCAGPITEPPRAFSAAAGGALCPPCQPKQRDRAPLSRDAWLLLRAQSASGDAWQHPWSPAARAEVRQLLGHYVTYWMGRRPRLLPYLGS
jgi:DNA repair protein RecO (recombination protein O)